MWFVLGKLCCFNTAEKIVKPRLTQQFLDKGVKYIFSKHVIAVRTLFACLTALKLSANKNSQMYENHLDIFPISCFFRFPVDKYLDENNTVFRRF